MNNVNILNNIKKYMSAFYTKFLDMFHVHVEYMYMYRAKKV